MNKKKFYAPAILLLVIAVAFIVFNYYRNQQAKENRTFALLERKGASAGSAEWKEVQQKAKTYLAAVEANPDDTKSALKLAALYIQEARETGNHVYYDPAAMKYINLVLENDPAEFNALVFKSLIYLSQHHFAEGLATAKQAQQVNPANAYVYGLLVDGYVEMGYYDSAITCADKMVSIRPDLTSYSRISYLREIYGDNKGAIEAMRMAVTAGGQGDEHTEWTRTQLGGLYERTGNLQAADSLYNISLGMRPDYPYALAGLARIALAKNEPNAAILYYEKANANINDNGLKEELVEAYRQAGQEDKATALLRTVIKDLAEGASAADADENIGHYSDRELAYAYIKEKKYDKALEHAMLEYNRRPKNIDVNEAVAWTYYNAGKYDKALPYMKEALKTNCRNPVLLSRAALVYNKAGEPAIAKTMAQEAASSKAYTGHALSAEMVALLKN